MALFFSHGWWRSEEKSSQKILVFDGFSHAGLIIELYTGLVELDWWLKSLPDKFLLEWKFFNIYISNLCKRNNIWKNLEICICSEMLIIKSLFVYLITNIFIDFDHTGLFETWKVILCLFGENIGAHY